MALQLPVNFSKDIQGRDTNLVPLVSIGTYSGDMSWASTNDWFGNTIHLSTNSRLVESAYSGVDDRVSVITKPILINIPSLKESIDIEKRNYKISSINIDISNMPYEGVRFSDLYSDTSLINVEVRIYWLSQSSKWVFPNEKDQGFGAISEAANMGYQIYFGTIRKYDHDTDKVHLVVEDRSQATLHKDLPQTILDPNDDSVPDKYKNKPIPMVYGHVDRSPCVVSKVAPSDDDQLHSSFTVAIDSHDISGYNDIELFGATPDPYGFLLVYNEGHYYKVSMYPVGGSLFGYAHRQIYSEDIVLPNVNMTSRFASESSGNPLADGFLEVEIIRYPKSASVYLLPQTQIEFDLGYNIQNSSFQPEYEMATFDHTLFTGKDFSQMWDNNSSTSVLSESYNVKGDTVVTPQIRGIGFNYMIDGLGAKGVENHVTYLLLKYELRTRWYSDAGYNFGEINLYHYSNALRTTIFQWNHSSTGEDGFPEYMLRDNLFSEASWAIGGDQEWATPTWKDFPLNWEELDTTNQINLYQMMHSGFHIPGEGDAMADSYIDRWGVYGVGLYQRLLLQKPTEQDFYANINGRAMDANNNSPTAPSAIKDILENELGQADIDAPPNYPTWKYAFTVDKKINSKKLLEGIASASPFVPRFNNMGEFKMNTILLDYTEFDVTAQVNGSENHTIKSDDCIDFSFSRTSVNDVKTRIDFHWNRNYATDNFDKIFTATIDEIYGTGYSHDYYGLTISYIDEATGEEIHPDSTLIIDDDRGKYIREDGTAKEFAWWMLSWHCNQHLKMKVKLPLKYMNLEIGDIVEFNKLLGGVEAYGIDYKKNSSPDKRTPNGQLYFPFFMISSTNKTLEFVTIECIMMHKLEIGACPQCEDDPEGCYDCNGVCDGNATIDPCGVCGGDAVEGEDCTECPDGTDPDCDGVCGGSAQIDVCGQCCCEGNICGTSDPCEAQALCWDDSIVCDISQCPENPEFGDWEAGVCENPSYPTQVSCEASLEPINIWQPNCFIDCECTIAASTYPVPRLHEISYQPEGQLHKTHKAPANWIIPNHCTLDHGQKMIAGAAEGGEYKYSNFYLHYKDIYTVAEPHATISEVRVKIIASNPSWGTDVYDKITVIDEQIIDTITDAGDPISNTIFSEGERESWVHWIYNESSEPRTIFTHSGLEDNDTFTINFNFSIKVDHGGQERYFIDQIQQGFIAYDCGVLGDVNDDGFNNVLDILALANCIGCESCLEDNLDCDTANGIAPPNGCAGDLTGDGYFNVLDLVTLASCILDESCNG